MKVVCFKSLSIRNFLSFGDKPQKIDLEKGVNAIVGVNHDKEDSKNGTGKSTVLEALYYALYGTTIRDLNKDLIIHSEAKKNCVVELDFVVGLNGVVDTYKIVRGQGPSKCVLFKNGTDVTLSTQARTTEEIQDIIRTPSSVFKNSVIMSVNSTTPFMALSKIDKRKYIESVLALDVFTQMIQKAKEENSTLKKDYEITFRSLQAKTEELAFLDKQIQEFEKNKADRLAALQTKIDRTKTDISTIEQSVPTPVSEDLHAETKAKLQKVKDKQKSLDQIKYKLAADIQGSDKDISLLQKQIDQINSNKEACPVCKRDFEDEHKTHAQSRIDDLQKQIEEVVVTKNKAIKNQQEAEKTQQTLSQQEKTVAKALEEIEETVQKQKQCKAQLAIIEKTLKEYEADKEKLLLEENKITADRISSLTSEAEKEQALVTKLNEDLQVIEAVRHVISEDGVKAYLVKKIIGALNARITFYLQQLDANCTCTFDEFFEDSIIDDKGYAKSYFSFSGGERKRIDLACLFAFADIRRMQGDVVFGNVFYDELLDSSLDLKGVQMAMTVLRDRFEQIGESSYVVTHRGDSLLDITDSIITVEKRNGVSYVS